MGRLLGLHFDHAHHLRGLVAGFALDILHQPDAGFFGGQSGNFLQTRLLIRHEFLQFFFFFLDKTFLLDHPF